MFNSKLILSLPVFCLFTGCSSFYSHKIDPYVVSPIETGPNQYLVVARASDYVGGEPLIRQIALSKATKKCSTENNHLQVIEIQNGRWSNGATISRNSLEVLRQSRGGQDLLKLLRKNVML